MDPIVAFVTNNTFMVILYSIITDSTVHFFASHAFKYITIIQLVIFVLVTCYVITSSVYPAVTEITENAFLVFLNCYITDSTDIIQVNFI